MRSVGDRIRTRQWRVVDRVWGRVEGRVWACIGRRVEGRVWNCVGDHVWKVRIWDLIREKVGDEG